MEALLFMAHQYATENSPICYYSINNERIISDDVFVGFSDDNNILDQFAERCLDDLNKLNLPQGTVHYGYKYWISVALNNIYAQRHLSTINIPNGCCNVESCPINKLYQIVYNQLQ
jgi:hypothetical protein